LKVEVMLNGRHAFRLDVTRPIDFAFEVPLPRRIPDASMLEVALLARRSFVPAAYGRKDHRRLSFQLKELALA
jgi:hypothetical protein